MEKLQPKNLKNGLNAAALHITRIPKYHLIIPQDYEEP